MKVMVIPIVIGVLGEFTIRLVQGLEDLGIRGWVETIQTIKVIKIGQSSRKSPGYLWIIVFAQKPVENHQQTLVWKTFKTVKYKALHPSDDVDRLYISRKEGGRGLASIEDSVDASIQRFEDYIEKHKRGLFTAIKTILTIRWTAERK